MRKILVISILFACIVAFAFFNSEAGSEQLKRIARHETWGPTCRKKCAANSGEICGYFSQGCCQTGHCATSFGGEDCQTGNKLNIAGCTTN